MTDADHIIVHVRDTTTTNAAMFEIQISLHATGIELKKMLIPLVKLPLEQMKIIFSGRVLKDDQTLKDQQFRNKIKVILMKQCTEEEKVALQKAEQNIFKLDRILEAAERVASRPEDDFRYTFEIRNQMGKKIHLPLKDRKALVFGMTLHEKGKKCLAERQWKQALEYFHQAEKGFKDCDPQYLELIDNYGYLNLDIAWTYYQLQNIQYLKEASWRLEKAEECFKRSHGEHQERLIALKGGACPELVIYARLYLLKAIVAFHSQSFQVAREFLDKAENKLNAMNVTTEESLPLLQMGFTPRECTLAMRATGKNVSAAAQYILHMREKKEEERKRREERRIQRKFGKTCNGKWINLQMYQRLKEMGFESKMIVEGLKQTDNDEEKTLQLLLQHPELLNPRIDELQSDVMKNLFIPKPEEIQQITMMGFSESMARNALVKSRGDINKAVMSLLNGEIFDSEENNNITQTSSNDNQNQGQSKSAKEKDKDNDKEMDEEKRKKRQLEKEAEYELVNDIPTDEEAYLDINLDEEIQILKLYKEYLEKATTSPTTTTTT